MSLSVFLDREELFIFSLRMTGESDQVCHALSRSSWHDKLTPDLYVFGSSGDGSRQEKEYYCVGKICDGSKERVKVIWSKFRQMLWVGGTE